MSFLRWPSAWFTIVIVFSVSSLRTSTELDQWRQDETSLLQVQSSVKLGALSSESGGELLRLESTPRLHPWKNYTCSLGQSGDVLALGDEEELRTDEGSKAPKRQKELAMNVYFVRHGQNIVNQWLVENKFMLPFPHTEQYYDAKLTRLGVEQAVEVQKILSERLGLAKVPHHKIQLAASLNSRAFDTLVIGSAPLWRAWSASGVSYQLHEVPAAMELDKSINSQRKPGVLNDDPVRWEDSVLSGELAHLTNTGGARDIFYETTNDRKQFTEITQKPVQVRSYFERELKNFEFGGCNSTQMDNLGQYLLESAAAGKEHVVVGTHGYLILCMMNKYSRQDRVETSSGGKHATKTEGLPNAVVLHLRLNQNGGERLSLEPQMLYLNPLESH